MTKQIAYISIASIIYGYFFLRTYFPKLVKNHSSIVEKVQKEHNIDDISKREAKKILFKEIGKSDNKILIDIVMTDAKDLLKFSPVIIAIITRNPELYYKYSVPLTVAFVFNKGLKALVKKERPDGINLRSFPSGHAISSFVGATFLYSYFGPKIGIPVMILATLVSTSRVYCERHEWIDIIAGCLIGVLSALVLK